MVQSYQVCGVQKIVLSRPSPFLSPLENDERSEFGQEDDVVDEDVDGDGALAQLVNFPKRKFCTLRNLSREGSDLDRMEAQVRIVLTH